MQIHEKIYPGLLEKMSEKKPTLLRCIFSSLVILGLTGINLAQDDFDLPISDKTQQSAQSSKASHYYEVLIKDVMKKYYDDRTFLVDVRVLVNEGETPEEEGDLEGIYTLPGLPVLPKSMQEEGTSVKKTKAKSSDLSIDRVEAELMVDTSYNEKDFAFIKKLITMSANLNEYRGDVLEIRSGIFPVQKKPGSGYALAESMGNQPPASDPSLDNKKPLEATLSDNPFEPFIKNLGSLIPLIIILIFVLLVVLVIAKALARGRQKTKDNESYQNIISGIQELKEKEKSEAETKAQKTAADDSSGPREGRELRSYLLSAFIGDTGASTKVLTRWITEDPEKGIEKSAKLIKAVDERLLKVVSHDLGKETSQQLEARIKFMEPVSAEETHKILFAFKTDFSNLSSSIVNESEYADLFGFLRQMNEQQILHLLQEESEGIIGMVMAQIDPAKASSMIQKLDKSKRTKVLAGMGKIQNIPLNVYKELADRLSAKALEVINMRYVASDGVESVLEVLDSMPVSVQSEYLNSIAEVDLNLAEKIKNNFITLPEVATLPDKFLSNALRSVGQDVIINTLVGAEDDLKEKVLKILPDRMQQMIQSGLDSNIEVSSENIEAAQKRFLQRIRQEIKAAGGRPEPETRTEAEGRAEA